MAVNPITFSGMIQNTHDLSSNKTQADQRPLVQQDVVANTNRMEARQSTQIVSDSQETSKDSFDTSEGGDGTGYQGNRNRKKNNEKKKVQPVSDGAVKNKGSRSSFDASV